MKAFEKLARQSETWTSMEPMFQTIMPLYAAQDRDGFPAIQPQWSRLNEFLKGEAARLLRRRSQGPLQGTEQVAVQDWHRTMWEGSAQAWDRGRDFGPWGHQILKNICARDLASVTNAPPINDDCSVPDEKADVFEAVANDDARVVLMAAIQNLPHRHRELILDKYFAGRTGVEIAQARGYSESTVSRDLGRAIRSLRDALGAS